MLWRGWLDLWNGLWGRVFLGSRELGGVGTLRAEVLEFLRALLWIQGCAGTHRQELLPSPLAEQRQELGSSAGACQEHFLTQRSLAA